MRKKSSHVVLTLIIAMLALQVLFLAGCSAPDPEPADQPRIDEPRFDYERLFTLNDSSRVKEFFFRNSDFHVIIGPYEMYEIDPETGRYRSADTFTVYGAMVIVQSPKTRSITKRGKTMEQVFEEKYQNLTPSSFTYPEAPSCSFWEEPDDEYPLLHGRCYEQGRDLVLFLEAGGETDNEVWMETLLDLMVS